MAQCLRGESTAAFPMEKIMEQFDSSLMETLNQCCLHQCVIEEKMYCMSVCEWVDVASSVV